MAFFKVKKLNFSLQIKKERTQKARSQIYEILL